MGIGAISVGEISSIAITTAPTKVVYTVGDYFDPTGMVVTATYDNEETRVIANTYLTYSPTLETALQTTDESITITYEGETATQSITVQSDNKVVTSVTVESVSTTKDANNDWQVTLSSVTTAIDDIVVVLEDANATYTLTPESIDSVTSGRNYSINLRVVAENGSHQNYAIQIQ